MIAFARDGVIGAIGAVLGTLFFSSRRRHTRCLSDWSSDVCSSDLAGFLIGHATNEPGRTGCTVVLVPPATRGGVDVRGGGPGTRETDVIGPLAGTDQVTAVLLTGGSAFGLAAADGVVRWCEEQGRGYPTAAGVVPIVPAAVVYDLAAGDPRARPGPGGGYAGCAGAAPGVPAGGRVGRGAGNAVG